MTLSSLRQILRSFWLQTSIKGVPRAVQSSSGATRFCWGAATLACLAMLLYQTSTLLVKYYQYAVAVTWQELEVAPDFPDISVCNQKPNDQLSLLNLTVTQYYAHLDQLQALVRARAAVDPSISPDYLDPSFWHELHGQRSYIVNNPLFRNAFPLSSANSSFVVDCTWYTWSWRPLLAPPGSGLGCTDNVLVRWSPDYYKCYTYKAPSAGLMGFTSTHYISAFPSSVVKPFFLILSDSITSGLRMSVQARDTYQEILQGVNLPHGKEITIKILEQTSDSLPLPYSPQSPCTTQTLLDPLDPNSYRYSLLSCLSVCRQQRYVDRCGCLTTLEAYTERQMDSVNATFCPSNLMAGVNETNVFEVLEKIYCYFYDNKPNSACDCLNPCQGDSYSWSISVADWPATENHLAFYEKYIRPHPEIYGSKFKAYEQILGNPQNLSISDLLVKIDSIGLIQQNFIQLKVLIEKESVRASREIPVIASDTLFSNLGSILNLWMGVTVMFAAECMELLFSVMGWYWNEKSTAKEEEMVVAGEECQEFKQMSELPTIEVTDKIDNSAWY